MYNHGAAIASAPMLDHNHKYMSNINVHEEISALSVCLDQIESLLAWDDAALFTAQLEISAWSPAHHVHHVAVATGMMLMAGIRTLRRDPDPEEGPNRIGQMVLQRGMGSLRGRGQAPKATTPPDTFARTDLDQALERCRRKISETEAILDQFLVGQGRLPHPYFGPLNATEWLRITRLHAEHHLAIIGDIAPQAA